MYYRISNKKDRMYDVDFDTQSEVKLNEGKSDEKNDELYYGECTAELFSENIRRLMHTGKYNWKQTQAITYSQCEKGTAHKEE